MTTVRCPEVLNPSPSPCCQTQWIALLWKILTGKPHVEWKKPWLNKCLMENVCTFSPLKPIHGYFFRIFQDSLRHELWLFLIHRSREQWTQRMFFGDIICLDIYGHIIAKNDGIISFFWDFGVYHGGAFFFKCKNQLRRLWAVAS